MKIIDLLNKIANGEEVPKKIRFQGDIFEYIDGGYEDKNLEELDKNAYLCFAFLNDIAEIIEEDKKIEKLTFGDVNGTPRANENDIIDKINELIDEVNKLKDDNK